MPEVTHIMHFRRADKSKAPPAAARFLAQHRLDSVQGAPIPSIRCLRRGQCSWGHQEGEGCSAKLDLVALICQGSKPRAFPSLSKLSIGVWCQKRSFPSPTGRHTASWSLTPAKLFTWNVFPIIFWWVRPAVSFAARAGGTPGQERCKERAFPVWSATRRLCRQRTMDASTAQLRSLPVFQHPWPIVTYSPR